MNRKINNTIKLIFLSTILFLFALGCGNNGNNGNNDTNTNGNTTNSQTVTDTTGTLTIKGEVWADNWFAFYLGDKLIIEDSVSINTERSFNAESFTFKADYPLSLNFIAKDFKENDTGLEYIGDRNQQMGDGGFIAQFSNETTGETIAVTNQDWKCMVIHEAPLDKSCESESNPVANQGACGFIDLAEPENWKSATFDDSTWPNASTYTDDQVGPKDGYDQITWDAAASLIWTGDLETHNTILCRTIIQKP